MAGELQVVIATAGRPVLLERTLDSFAAGTRPSIFRGIIVVENGPPAGAEQVVAKAPADLNVRYIHTELANKSNALNVAVTDLADGCLALFTDDDVRVVPDFLQRYADAAAGIESGQFFGGPMEAEYETEPLPWVRPYLPGSAVGWSPFDKPVDPASLVFLGCNWAAFVGDLKRAGLFDIRLGPGGTTDAVAQDWQMQINLHKIGVHAVVVPDATVFHYVPAERCSASWTRNRGFRNGIRWGNQLRAARGIAKLRMSPRILLTAAIGTLGYAVTRLCWSDRARFWAEYKQHQALGIVKGFSIKR